MVGIIIIIIANFPGPGFGDAVEMFREKKIPVTHFINGNNLVGNEGAANHIIAAVRDGQLIADHSFDHRLTKDGFNNFKGVSEDIL